MRKTSIDTYHQIKAEGLLSKLRFEVYEYIYEYGPTTCREAMMAIQKSKGKSFVIAGSSLSGRFSELEKLGVVEITQIRPCKESGRMSMEWDVTAELPRGKIVNAKNKSRKELEQEIVELKRRVKDLQDELEKWTLGVKRRNRSKDHQKAISRGQTSMF